MKRIKEEIVESTKRYWRSTLTSFLTFLSSKLAGVNTLNEVHAGQREDEGFIDRFLQENGRYYNPCSNNYPQKPDAWFRTIWQYRYKPAMPYSTAFESSTKGFYKFSNDYIQITKKYALKVEKISLSNIAIWLFRNGNFDIAEELVDLRQLFVDQFHITHEELTSLFLDDTSEFEQIFDTEPIFSSRLAQIQKSIDIPKTPIAVDINEPLETVRVQCTTYRILRDTKLTLYIKFLHNYQCQLCGETILLGNGKPYAEAHHIKPLGSPHNGLDVAGNILCICPNHHVQLDYGCIQIEKANLRTNLKHEIADEYVEYHNSRIFHGCAE